MVLAIVFEGGIPEAEVESGAKFNVDARLDKAPNFMQMGKYLARMYESKFCSDRLDSKCMSYSLGKVTAELKLTLPCAKDSAKDILERNDSFTCFVRCAVLMMRWKTLARCRFGLSTQCL